MDHETELAKWDFLNVCLYFFGLAKVQGLCFNLFYSFNDLQFCCFGKIVNFQMDWQLKTHVFPEFFQSINNKY